MRYRGISYEHARRLSLCVAAVLAVLLTAVRPAGATDWVVRSSFDDTRLVSDASGFDISFGRAVHRGALVTGHRSVAGTMRLSVIQPHGELSTVDPGGFTMILHNESAATALDGSLSWQDSLLTLGGGCLLRSERRSGWHLTAGARCGNIAGASVLHDESEHLPGYLFLSYLDEGGELRFDAPLVRDRITVGLAPLTGWTMSSWIETGRFRPHTPDLSNDPDELFRATIVGDIQRLATVLSYDISSTWRLSGEYEELSADAALMGYSDGRRFAHFGVLDLSAHWWRIDLAGPRVRGVVWDGRVSGNAAGTVQAFPFFDDLLGFLGQRRHVIADANLAWRLTGLSGTVLDRRITLDCGASWLRLRPRATVVSWRPGPLGLGVEDLTADSLSVRRADLLRLESKVSTSALGLDLTARVSQWLPLSVLKYDTAPSATGGASGAASSGSQSSSGHSGFGFALAISRRI